MPWALLFLAVLLTPATLVWLTRLFIQAQRSIWFGRRRNVIATTFLLCMPLLGVAGVLCLHLHDASPGHLALHQAVRADVTYTLYGGGAADAGSDVADILLAVACDVDLICDWPTRQPAGQGCHLLFTTASAAGCCP